MITLKNIMVPVDFSEHSHKALDYAREFVQFMKSRLHIIHVVEPPVYPADWGYAQVGFVDLERELTGTAENELHLLRKKLEAQGHTVLTKVLHGRASEEIVCYARDNDIDMISIATHGRSGLEHFLFGSTTERVLRKAPCPVLAVRLTEEDMEKARANDGDEDSDGNLDSGGSGDDSENTHYDDATDYDGGTD